jgi:UDP-N-acetylglucosamine 3-dehydrogenase
LIGCGQQGRQLAEALSRVAGTELIACSDPDGAAVDAVAGPRVARFASYYTMLAQTKLDAVIVATSHEVLGAATLVCLQAGCHVFCEKPLATSADGARAAVEAARRGGRNLMVGYIQRFDPLRRRMKELLDRGAFGELAYVVASKGGPVSSSGWHGSRARGGGQLLWVGSHLVDQLHWLLGRRVERVFAEMQRSPDTAVDLTSVITLRFEGGLVAHLDCSQVVFDIYDYIEAVGLDGRGRSEWRPDYRLRVHSRRVPEFESPRTLTQAPLTIERGCVAELNEFTSSIVESRSPCVTGDDALRVLEVLDAVVLSAESGLPISLRGSDDA